MQNVSHDSNLFKKKDVNKLWSAQFFYINSLLPYGTVLYSTFSKLDTSPFCTVLRTYIEKMLRENTYERDETDSDMKVSFENSRPG